METTDQKFEREWAELGKRLVRHAERSADDDEARMLSKAAETLEVCNALLASLNREWSNGQSRAGLTVDLDRR